MKTKNKKEKQTMNTQKMINEKPSKLANLGAEVFGAKRHFFDTYDNPEKRAEKEREKKKVDARKGHKETAISSLSPENYIPVLCQYEMALALEKIEGYEGNRDGSQDAVKELKTYVQSLRITGPVWVKGQNDRFNAAADAFNRYSRAISKIRWNVRSFEDAQKYLAPKKKESFKEFNGVEKPWNLGENEKFNPESVSLLSEVTRAVQFGNSLTLAEREYCLHNLLSSITLLNTKYTFNFKDLAFSFGARGKPGSIAHYQNSLKVLAFNRGWSGAFIHELGHAVDYSLNLPSNNLPWTIRSAYRVKLKAAAVGPWMKYYMEPVEIFARLFEVYLREEMPEMTDFMQFTHNEGVMPDLTDESRNWMKETLKTLVKGE
jgi:hypothetical protein